MFVRLAVVLVVVGFVAADDFINIGFRDCKSQFKVTEVKAKGCDLKETSGGKKVCLFAPNSKPTIRIKFTPDESAAELRTSIKAKIGETMIDFPLSDNNACNFGLGCPLQPGQEYIYEQGIEIASNYPAHDKVQVNWVLDREGAPGKDVCIIFLAQINE